MKRIQTNIKLLRGYGFSISLKNNKIILKDGANDITGESLKYLEEVIRQNPDKYKKYAKVDDDLESLKGNPKFEELIK